MITYKIMEKHNGEYRTLFHGNFGSRTIPVGEWQDAQIREQSKDGASKTFTGYIRNTTRPKSKRCVI